MMIIVASRSRWRLRAKAPARAGSILLYLLLLHSMGMLFCGSANALESPPDAMAGSLPDPLSCQYSCSGDDPLSSLEEVLRGQAQLLAGFAILLDKTNRTTNESIDFLDSFEDLLRRQAGLYSGFESLLKSQWYNLDCEQQKIFLDSFEDLLKRQNRLYKSFNLLLNDEPTLDNDVMVDFLAAYENLLRIEANLYMSFYNLLNMKYEGQGPCNATPPGCVPPTITVERIEMNPGQKFVINVTNNDAVSLNVTNLTGTGGLVNSTGAIYSITDTNWTLAGNVGIYNNLPASIGPGATQTFVLDDLLIGGTVILPDDLVFTFCATTDCGQVCMTDIDNILFLAPLPP